MKDNQQVSNVFELLFIKVVCDKESKTSTLTKPKYGWSGIAPTSLTRLYVIGVVFFSLLAYISSLSNKTTIIAGQLIAYKTIYAIIAACFLLFYEILWIRRSIQQLKSPQEEIEEDFNKAKDEAITTDWQIVEDLIKQSNSKKEVLEYVKTKIVFLIEKRQDRANTTQLLVKIFAALIVVMTIVIFFSSNLLIKVITSGDVGVWSGRLALFSAAVAGITLIFELFLASTRDFQIIKLKRCLYLLEQAQLIINNVENNKKTTQSQQLNTEHSLISKLKNIKIDGPDDFAANLDLYLSGDKRIEPDIR